MNRLHNNEKTGVWIGLLITLIGLALVVVPPLFGADMMAIGFGLACTGIFLLIPGLLTTWVFAGRARIMDRILAGEEILARWKYDDFQGHRQVEAEAKRSRGRNLVIYRTIVFWFVLIGGIFVAFDYFSNGEVSWLFVGSFFGFMCLLGGIAFLAPILWHRQASKASREVIISRDGVVMNGALSTWKPPFEQLKSVKFIEGLGEPTLVFTIRYLSRISLVAHENVVVPVPASEQEAARRVVSMLNRDP